MQYQDQPKGGQICDTSLQWKVVDGTINPKGWCVAYVKKP